MNAQTQRGPPTEDEDRNPVVHARDGPEQVVELSLSEACSCDLSHCKGEILMKLLKILFRMTFMPVAWTIRLMIAAIAFLFRRMGDM